jgi:hypothetical protein
MLVPTVFHSEKLQLTYKRKISGIEKIRNPVSTDYEISFIICNFINFTFSCALYENGNRQKKKCQLINKYFFKETIDILIEFFFGCGSHIYHLHFL